MNQPTCGFGPCQQLEWDFHVQASSAFARGEHLLRIDLTARSGDKAEERQ